MAAGIRRDGNGLADLAHNLSMYSQQGQSGMCLHFNDPPVSKTELPELVSPSFYDKKPGFEDIMLRRSSDSMKARPSQFNTEELSFFSKVQVVWLSERVMAGMKGRVSRRWWKRFFEDPKAMRAVEDFIEGRSSTLVFYITRDESFKVMSKVPTTPSCQKCMVFWRRSKKYFPLNTTEAMMADVVGTHFRPESLNIFRLELESIFIPYILGAKSGMNWPKVVQHDVIRHTQKFSGILQHFEGQIRGIVILPLPPEVPAVKAEISSNMNDKKRRAIHIYETAIVEWSRHIRAILNKKSLTKLDQLEACGTFPGALLELQFWQHRHGNLRGVVQQLSSSRVRGVVEVLTKANSAYVTAFDILITELDQALVEARDIHIHLLTLKKPLEKLESSAFRDIPGYLPQIFHLISLVWHTSSHYDMSCLMVLFRMLSNTIVTKATMFLTETDLFGDSPAAVLAKLKDALHVTSRFKELFFAYRTQVNAQQGRPWWLEETPVFSRVDKILQRIRDLVEVFEVRNRFSKLEHFEPGGDRGADLGKIIKQVYKEFHKETLTWGNIVNGIIDPSSPAFEEAYVRFTAKVAGFDDRIALVVAKSFSGSQPQRATSLFDSIGQFRNSAITTEKESKLTELVTRLRTEVEHLFHTFESRKVYWEVLVSGAEPEGQPPQCPVPSHLPNITSMHLWVNALLNRVRTQLDRLVQLSRKQFKTPEGTSVQNMVRIFEETLVKWKEAKTTAWKTHVTTLCLDRLDNPLLKRLGASGLLVVSFDRGLAQALEDVSALQCTGVDLGHKVKSVFAQRGEFRVWIAKLEIIASQYNRIVETVIEVERPLVRKALDQIHSILDEGLIELTWRSPRINDFVSRASKAVSCLHGNMIYLKGNISVVTKILKNWKTMHKVIHFSEEESWESRKKSILHELTEIWQGEASSGLTDQERVGRKWLRKWREKVSLRIRSLDDIVRQYNRIRRLIDGSRQVLGVDAHSPAWCTYLDYVNKLFVTGFILAVKRSLEYLLKFLEVVKILDAYGKPPEHKLTLHTKESSPLMHIKLILANGEAAFSPSIHRDDFGSVQYRVYEWCNTIFEVGRQLPRLDDPSNHYYVLLFDHPELNIIKDEILRLMVNTVNKLEAVRMDFLKYSYLYQDDIDTYVERFATKSLMGDGNHEKLPEPFEDLSNENDSDEDSDELQFTGEEEAKPDGVGLLDSPANDRPTIAEFEAQIIKYERLRIEIEGLPSEVSYGWITLDTSIIKSELVRLACEWRTRFLSFQRNKLIQNLARFKEFVAKTQNGIAIHSLDHVKNYQDLVSVMRHLVKFQANTEQFDRMYEPSKSVVVLLKKHDIHLPSTVLSDVENAPVLWRDLKKRCFFVNEMLAPRQIEEVTKIRAMELSFEKRTMLFYTNTFQKKEPTSLDTPPRLAYKMIQELHVMVLHIEHQLRELRQKQRLFQLMPSPGRAVKNCRTDLILLKYLWDAASLALYQMEAWNHVPCSNVNLNEMEERVQRLISMINSLDKRVRRWDVYRDIEAKAKNFLVSLPLIQSLRTPAMRPIHWEELMAKTGVFFDFKELTIENLISLNLHKLPDEVVAIVGKAVRQAQIEEQLTALDKAWDELLLQFDTQQGVDYPSFSVPDIVQVTIEEHQLLLQGLCQNRYVSEYLNEVQAWQKTLATVESVLTMFIEVQKMWRHLQTIFIGSDDIKSQLPRHTQLFLELDGQVKLLLREAARTPYIVPLCCNEGRETALLALQGQLTNCERALEGYMNQKRKTFPRFYFVSTPHLLEILSKASKDPAQIMMHIPRVMQDIATFTLDGYMAVGVLGCGGETFSLSNTVICSSRVEHWLQNCVESVATTIFTLIEQAILSSSGKSKSQWMKQYITQVVLVASHIHWTVDVSSTFHAMEEGNETALKEQHRRCQEQLNELIELVPNSSLTSIMRRRVMNLVIQAVHQTDVLLDLVDKKAESKNAFAWQRQLRHRLNEKTRGVIAEICDCSFNYGGEYNGDNVRLIVTPLTERIYITLTQSMRLKMGGAPSGPAGTGKTETVKDLAKQLGRACYVFNCSEQMTFSTLSSVFKGLASGGVWGCFDEFNRIRLSVLSVVALQFKHIFDAQRQNKKEFFVGKEEANLHMNCNIFITMNPGYLGRTELPDSLKALFRPVTVVAPDNAMICENLLLAEGFSDARNLAKKFIALFELSEKLLSKQSHYDWGLRSIKSLLVAAGELKRCKRNTDEQLILMQALRDFNLPKVVAVDIDIFCGIINDLFPGVSLTVNRRAEKFDKCIKQVCSTLGMQPEEGLLTKCHQLHELREIRHCVMVVGKPATGKTTTRKILLESYRLQGYKYVDKVINPKAVTTSELFGYVDRKNEWKDGLASSIIRNCTTLSSKEHSWVIFDGDIDTEWIESMNSAMDDNKVLTLASNDRIQLTPNIVLMFEVGNLQYTTPATVSRAGILYISSTDIGWLPYLQSWFDKKQMGSTITPLIDKYVQKCLDFVCIDVKTTLPQSEFSLVRQLCAYVDLLLRKEESAEIHNEREAEHWFIFACIWAFGGALNETVHRARFDRWWRAEWKCLKFPEAGTVFDYCLSSESKKLEKWSETAKKMHNPEPLLCSPLSTQFVTTPSLCVVKFFFDRLIEKKQPILLVGGDACGKTLLVQDRMKILPESTAHQNVCFNYYTTATSLQGQLQLKLERKMGRRWGPIGHSNLIWILDDINTPMVEKYGTQTPLALLRQLLDYKMWYEKARWQALEINDVQLVSIMNPTQGSYTINQRFQRHFVCLQVPTLARETVSCILNKLITNNISCEKGLKTLERLIETTLDIHDGLRKELQKTAVKFYYALSMRQLTQVFEGIVLGCDGVLLPLVPLLKLWVHEVHRTYSDRLYDIHDVGLFRIVVKRIAEQAFSYEPMIDDILCSKLLYGTFHNDDSKYSQLPSVEKLIDCVNSCRTAKKKLPTLVIFEQAALHVQRVCRVLDRQQGHMCLIGVSGSGKQSIVRLAAYLSQISVMTPSSENNMPNFRDELKSAYLKSGVKGEKTLFLLTESQILKEEMLTDISSLLSTNDMTEIFNIDEREEVIRKVRLVVRNALIVDTAENCWQYFIEQVQEKLHCILCFHPGEAMRVRARRFPALMSHTLQDFFHPWDEQALVAVGEQKLVTRDISIPPPLDSRLVRVMAKMHITAEEVAADFSKLVKYEVAVTCKAFMTFLDIYGHILVEKLALADSNKIRLEAGLAKLKTATTDTYTLQEVLAKKQQQVVDKKAQVDELLHRLGQEKQVVTIENSKSTAEESRATEMQKLVSEKSAEMQTDLARAEPLIEGAQRALDTINKANMIELKSFKSPPMEVQNVLACVIILLTPPPGARDKSWQAAHKLMQRVDVFLASLRNYKKESIPDSSIAQLRPYLSNPDFTGEVVGTKSQAAAGLCEWVRNIVKYYEVYCFVQPKRQQVMDGKLRLEEANSRVSKIKAHVEKLHSKFGELETAVEEARADRDTVIQQAQEMGARLELSQRLVGALGSEQDRWLEGVTGLEEKRTSMIGNVLLAAALTCYAGPFDVNARKKLLDSWCSQIVSAEIPHTEEGMDPVNTLSTPAQLAEWFNQSLPRDSVSIQNACICHWSIRPCLLLDPQYQGLAWVHSWNNPDSRKESKPEIEEADKTKKKRVQLSEPTSKVKKPAVFTRQNSRELQDQLEAAASNGTTIIVEKIFSEVHPLLKLLLRATTGQEVKFKNNVLRIHSNFRLILHSKQKNPVARALLQSDVCAVNFAVTEEGLEEQLLALVVNKEKPGLEAKKQDILFCMNRYKINIMELEDGLIQKISQAGNTLIDSSLVSSLEEMKSTVVELNEKVQLAKTTDTQLNEARDKYRPVARRGSMIYFLLLSIEKLEWLYQYSLHSFALLFLKAIEVNTMEHYDAFQTEESYEARISNLVDNVTLAIGKFVKRGILVKHRMVFELLLCFNILSDSNLLPTDQLSFLLSWEKPRAKHAQPTTSWLTQDQWDNLCYLSTVTGFNGLASDVEKRLKRWKDWANSEQPEEERLPGEARHLGTLEQMLIIKVLRPDRLEAAASKFVQRVLGVTFTRPPSLSVNEALRETSPVTPLLFILFPGSDPLKEIEAIAHKLAISESSGNFRTVAMGDGQEEEAKEALEECSKNGGWVVLTNIHLMGSWLSEFEMVFEEALRKPNKDLRIFLTAEPSDDPRMQLPQGVVQQSIKLLSNEPSFSLHASMQRSWVCFANESAENPLKKNEHKRLLFALAYFHSVVVCRKRFGEHGWSKLYAFSTSDLLISSQILSNHLGSNGAVPWDDIRYILGEVMYGGHITDQWDRRTLSVLLQTLLNDAYLQNGRLAQDLVCPAGGTFQHYGQFIEHNFPSESPALLHMHPNAEMWYLTQQARSMVSNLSLLCSPEQMVEGDTVKRDQKLKETIEDMYARLPENFNMNDMQVAALTPVAVFVMQEIDSMNRLLTPMRIGLWDCLQGLKGTITVSEQMDGMLQEISRGHVPTMWMEWAYPSVSSLTSWYNNLQARHQHLDAWMQHMTLPVCVWISGLFHPEAFLTLVLQMTARKTNMPLDSLVVTTDVVKNKTKEDLTHIPREGAYIYGLYLEGAGWNAVNVCSF